MKAAGNKIIFWLCLAGGAVSLTTGVLLTVASRSLFDAQRFGERLGDSLRDPGVAQFAAEKLTDAVIHSSPDLIGARPFIVAAAHGLVHTRPFQVLTATAGSRAHQALFSKGAQSVVLSLPDVQVLVRSALAQASPALAAKMPKEVETVVAHLGEGKGVQVLIDGWRLASRLRWSARTLLFLGPALLLFGLWFAPSRRLGFFRAGLALTMSGLVTIGVIPLARLVVHLSIADPLGRDAAVGLTRTFLAANWYWGTFLAGFGVLMCAGAASLLEGVDLRASARRAAAWLVTPPPTPAGRWAWSVGMLGAGMAALMFPFDMAAAVLFVAGGVAAYAGVRELFRLLLERVDQATAFSSLSSERRWVVHVMVVLVSCMALGGAWFLLRSPSVQVAAPQPLACNGMPELCDKRVDEVVFPGAHNAMSNQEAPHWMFPHHQAAMTKQLRDGIRALLIDIHYGFPGGARIKTDLGAGQSRERLVGALGQEGFDAAMRIRGRLVGVEEGKRGMYFCHGFCEIGSYEVGPVLEGFRDFLVENPDEVVIAIVEDYVTPEDLAAAFDKAKLSSLVYKGAAPPWPTLRQLIESGERLIVFSESGRAGIPWIRPAFETFQETPYSFHKVEEMSCAPNRGGTGGSMFLVNNWIETTPSPRPSNAALVNARDFLYQRAERCRAERRHVPNIIAVDFYGTGDVVRVAQELNHALAMPPGATGPPGPPGAHPTREGTPATP